MSTQIKPLRLNNIISHNIFKVELLIYMLYTKLEVIGWKL